MSDDITSILPPDALPVDPLAPKEHPSVAAFGTYQMDKSPASLHAVLKTLKPTIQYGLASFSSGDDPYLKTQANLLAAKAVQKYDPAGGASLPTWVSGQLMQLGRVKRQSSMPVKIPERTQLAAQHLLNTEMEFMEREGREPDAGELADASGMPIRQIRKVRRTFLKMPSQAALGEGGDLGSENTDFSGEAADYLYHELDHLDRKLLEFKTGYGGEQIASGKEIMQRLKLTPVQMSRRSTRLAHRLSEIEAAVNKAANV